MKRGEAPRRVWRVRPESLIDWGAMVFVSVGWWMILVLAINWGGR
jgi:hypothetical protein